MRIYLSCVPFGQLGSFTEEYLPRVVVGFLDFVLCKLGKHICSSSESREPCRVYG